MKLLYLQVDLFAVVIPLIFSFHPKIAFYKNWKAVIKAIIIIAVPFLTLDSIFISLGIWNFNPTYITGIHLYNLPIEEILFFVCIPYACVFTYYCLDKFFKPSRNPAAENIFCLLLSLFLLLTGCLFLKKIYTSSTFISAAILCLFLKFGLDIKWFGKAVCVFAILLLPFLIVNGILTGTGLSAPVVRYNPSYNLGIRLMTIPLEDFIYGFELFVLNLFLYLKFKEKSSKHLYDPSVPVEQEITNSSGQYKAV